MDKLIDTCVPNLSAFCNLTATEEDIKTVHNVVSPDIDLATLADQYADLQLLDPKPVRARHALKFLCLQAQKSNDQPNAVETTLARIKPHSADRKRIISSYNRLKSKFRSSFDRQMIVDSLYILPDKTNHTYSLRPRSHSFSLTVKTDSRNYINRMLFKDIY